MVLYIEVSIFIYKIDEITYLPSKGHYSFFLFPHSYPFTMNMIQNFFTLISKQFNHTHNTRFSYIPNVDSESKSEQYLMNKFQV